MKIKSSNFSGPACAKKEDLAPFLLPNRVQDPWIIPFHTNVKKDNEAFFERKMCQFSIVITLEKNEKLSVAGFSQKIQSKISKGSDVQAQLSVYMAGRGSQKPITLDFKTDDQNAVINEEFKSETALDSSGCGQDFILRGQISLLIKGKPKAEITTEDLQVILKKTLCK